MRPLTPKEKSLLTLLGVIAFAGLNFFGYRALQRTQAAQKLEVAELSADQAEAKVSLLKRTVWQKREAWILQHEPKTGDEGDAKAKTLQAVLGDARSHGLEVVEQNLHDSTQDPDGFRVEIVLTIKGSLQALSAWLAGLQDPASFYAVPSLSLKADEEKKTMVCTLRIERFFRREKG